MDTQAPGEYFEVTNPAGRQAVQTLAGRNKTYVGIQEVMELIEEIILRRCFLYLIDAGRECPLRRVMFQILTDVNKPGE
jgi:hypothetical protein